VAEVGALAAKEDKEVLADREAMVDFREGYPFVRTKVRVVQTVRPVAVAVLAVAVRRVMWAAVAAAVV